MTSLLEIWDAGCEKCGIFDSRITYQLLALSLYNVQSGSAKVEGRAKQTAKEIAKVLKTRFQEQGWIMRDDPSAGQ